MTDVFIFNEIWAQDKMCILKALCLVKMFYLSLNTGTDSEL
jgi:hypothetical protein